MQHGNLKLIPLSKAELFNCDIVGNKARNLSILMHQEQDFLVPDGIVLFFSTSNNIPYASSPSLTELADKLVFPLIIRSSSNAEDSFCSFAGLFLSKICYNKQDFESIVYEVFDSVNSDAVELYCNRRGIDYSSIKMAIIVQPFFNATISGVTFTCNPISNNCNEIVVEYLEGSSDVITSGEKIPQEIVIYKNEMHDLAKEYPDYIQRIVRVALALEIKWGSPVDIEWIVVNDKLVILQIRKITTC